MTVTMKKITLILPFALLSSVFADEASFAKHDGDNNGEVTYIEFAKVQKLEFDKLDRDRSKSLSMDEAGKAEAVDQYDLFALPAAQEMDANGDQQVALTEFGAAVKSVFDKLDAIESGSADGKVPKAEYLAAVSKKKAAAAAAKTAKDPKGSAAKKKGSAPKTP